MERRRGVRPVGRGGRVIAAAGLVGWCAWVSGFHRSTTPARLTWGLTLAAVVIVDVLLWQGRRGRRPGLVVEPAGEPWPRRGPGGRGALLGLSPWWGLTLVIVVWEILGIDTGPRQAHLTISAIASAFRSMNAILLFVWIAVGIAYGLARARAPLARSGPNRSEPNGPAQSFGALLLGHLPGAAPALLLPDSRAAGVVFWIGIVVVGVGVDLVARRSHGRLATFEELLRFVTAPTMASVVLVVAWLYAGYHLFAH